MKRLISMICLAVVLTIGGTPMAFSDGGGDEEFEVTITNLTRGQRFTPILVASHKKGIDLFTLGAAASGALATLAETGNTEPLMMLLMATPGVKDVVTVGPLLDSGAVRTITITGGGKFKHVSVAAMMIPTNDGFIALNGVKGLTGKTLTFYSPGYDAGSEVNDELCSSIPGPDFDECVNPDFPDGGAPGGGGAPGSGEGYVHIHAGIHGVGDMDASERDWRNPVAKITIVEADDNDDSDDN